MAETTPKNRKAINITVRATRPVSIPVPGGNKALAKGETAQLPEDELPRFGKHLEAVPSAEKPKE